MIRFLQPNDLATAPADRSFDVGNVMTARGGPRLYFEVANVSPYVFEVQDEGGQVRGIAGASQYTAIPLNPLTAKLTLHVIGTETSAPLPAANWAVYAGLTRNPPVPSAAIT